MRLFLILAAVLTVVFGRELFHLIKLSFQSELHNHLLLIPAISFYVWRFIDPRTAGAVRVRPSAASVWLVAGAGLASWLVERWLRQGGLPMTEHLWSGVLGYLLLLLAAAGWCFGWGRLREHIFALGFMVFFLPLPVAVTDGMSILLQRGSAEVASWTLAWSGLPVLREGLMFQLPGLTIQVAEECSGVRSTLVLLITSLLAGKMFLRSGWRRAVLAALTVPLGLLRNALRITVLSWLSVHVDPGVIHGPLHHQGGPIFFALSLLPLFVILWYFKKSEAAKSPESGHAL